ncbi:tetratricopeptide repeat protein [Flavobacterium sp.]|uniref:tetratricopeptide repeat protein n=1 Tax=Flavobacterium sp. TaxID=239 RepID=UPI003D14AE5D
MNRKLQNNLKLSTTLIFAFISFSSVGQTHTEKQIESVFKNLVLAYGNSKAAPKLAYFKKEAIKTTPALYTTSPQPTILVDGKFYDLCISFGKDSTNALAVVLSHELAHYYNDHTFCADFAFVVRKNNAELAQKLKMVSKSDKISRETQADYQGFFYAAIAGYNPFDCYDKTIDAIYKLYQLPESNPGYPSKAERKQMANAVKQKTSELYVAFKKSIQLKEEKKYEEAIKLLEKINTYFPSRENFNNLGVIKTLSALDLKVLTLEEHKYPKRFLYPLELDNSSRLNQNGTRGAEADQLKMIQLLKAAQKDFEKAISLDPNYYKAYVNLACVFDLLDNPEAAIGKIKELSKEQQNTNEAKRILAIAYYHADNENKAAEIWKEIE